MTGSDHAFREHYAQAREAQAFNAGVQAVLTIAKESADALDGDPRRIPVSFAQAALSELAEPGWALLLPVAKPEKDAP